MNLKKTVMMLLICIFITFFTGCQKENDNTLRLKSELIFESIKKLIKDEDLNITEIDQKLAIIEIYNILKENDDNKLQELLRKIVPDIDSLRLYKKEPKYTAKLYEGIDFKKDGYPEFLKLAEGFGGNENSFRWSLGNYSRLKFNKKLPKSFTLTIKAYAFGPNVNEPIKVIIGNKTKVLLINDHFKVYTLNFIDVESDTIKFVYPYPTSPKSLGINKDTRELSLSFEYIKIDSIKNKK